MAQNVHEQVLNEDIVRCVRYGQVGFFQTTSVDEGNQLQANRFELVAFPDNDTGVFFQTDPNVGRVPGNGKGQSPKAASHHKMGVDNGFVNERETRKQIDFGLQAMPRTTWVNHQVRHGHSPGAGSGNDKRFTDVSFVKEPRKSGIVKNGCQHQLVPTREKYAATGFNAGQRLELIGFFWRGNVQLPDRLRQYVSTLPPNAG